MSSGGCLSEETRFSMKLHTHLLSPVGSAASDTEQDAAVKLDQERAEIVAKYDKVRVQLAVGRGRVAL